MDLATSEVTDGLLQGAVVHQVLQVSMAHTPPCMMDVWTQEMLRLHPGFVGDEIMGKLALLATLLWTDISGVEARHVTIRRLLMNASAPCEAKRAKKAKLRAAVKEKRARAQAKAKATVLECATFAIVWRCEASGVALRKPKRTWFGCALWRYMCAARAALIISQMLRAEARSKKQPAAHYGAMRAFVRVKTLGTRGRLDFQAVAKQYKLERQSRSAD